MEGEGINNSGGESSRRGQRSASQSRKTGTKEVNQESRSRTKEAGSKEVQILNGASLDLWYHADLGALLKVPIFEVEKGIRKGLKPKDTAYKRVRYDPKKKSFKKDIEMTGPSPSTGLRPVLFDEESGDYFVVESKTTYTKITLENPKSKPIELIDLGENSGQETISSGEPSFESNILYLCFIF